MGTPQVLVVKHDEEELAEQIEHRKTAKERSMRSLSEWENVMNSSSFLGEEAGKESVLLFSRSSERDKIKLDEF